MKFVTTGVEFSFNQIMYKQIDGVAMGSPLGPLLANVFVGHYEKLLFSRIPTPLIYLRYVDDTFVLFKSSQDIENFHSELNNLHANLKFTKELEREGRLPFLDVMVERCDNRFVTTVYRKPTFTGEYVRWSSFCDRRRKINIIKTLVHRARSICSPEKLPEEFERIKSILIGNGYPENNILKVMNDPPNHSGNNVADGSPKSIVDGKLDSSSPADDQLKNRIGGHVQLNISTPCSQRPTDTNGEAQPSPPVVKDQPATDGKEDSPSFVYLRLPYIGSTGAQFRRRITVAVRKCYQSTKLRLIFTSRPNFPNAKKDALPTLQRSNIVYQFTCHCDSRYVGRTDRRLAKRISEHVPVNLRKTIGTPAADKIKVSSAIGQHFRANPVCFEAYSDDMFKVLHAGREGIHLNALESLTIMAEDPILCKQKSFVYTCLLFTRRH
jgi:hypothetical protein